MVSLTLFKNQPEANRQCPGFYVNDCMYSSNPDEEFPLMDANWPTSNIEDRCQLYCSSVYTKCNYYFYIKKNSRYDCEMYYNSIQSFKDTCKKKGWPRDTPLDICEGLDAESTDPCENFIETNCDFDSVLATVTANSMEDCQNECKETSDCFFFVHKQHSQNNCELYTEEVYSNRFCRLMGPQTPIYSDECRHPTDAPTTTEPTTTTEEASTKESTTTTTTTIDVTPSDVTTSPENEDLGSSST